MEIVDTNFFLPEKKLAVALFTVFRRMHIPGNYVKRNIT